MQLSRQLLLFFTMISLGLQAQNIGVKTGTPNAVLDVNGSVAYREGTPLSIVNGTNNNVAVDSMSFYRIVAPTAAFNITGFSSGFDGRLLTIINATSYTMTLKHLNSGSTASNRINTGGSDITIAANGVVNLYYNATLTNWIVTSSQGSPPNLTSITFGNNNDSLITINNGVPGRVPPQPYIETYAWGIDGNTGTTGGTHYVGTTDDQPLVFKTNATEAMRILPTSNVGINTSAPQYKLDIDAQTGSTGNPLRLLGLNAGATSDSIISSNGGILRRLSITQVISSGAWSTTGNSGLNATTNFVGTTDNIDLVFKVNNAQAGRISNIDKNAFFGYLAGNANTSQSNAFFGHQAATANTNGQFNNAFGYRALYTNTTGSNNTANGYQTMYLNTTGSDNVTMGYEALRTNATGNKNVAIGKEALYTSLGSNNIGLGYRAGYLIDAGSNNITLGYQAGRTIASGSSNIAIGDSAQVVSTTASNQLSIGNLIYGTSLDGRGATISTGNIGIATKTPQYKLDIDAQTSSAGNPLRLLGLNAGATSDSIISSSLGILRRLSINQIIANAWNITGNSGTVDGTNFMGTTDNIPLSIRVNNQKAGRIDHLLANSFWGYQAGNAVTTGSYNTAMGQSALAALTQGTANLGVGTSALAALTTGSDNTAVGSSTLATMTTGNSNVAIGNQSGLSNTTGVRNVSIGYQSARNGTHSNSVMIGYQAGLQNAASNNVFIGSLSGPLTSTGSDNIGMGYYTLFNNTTGKNNIGIGSFALSTTSAAWGNTAIGHMSSASIQTGQANTAVGDSSLLNNILGNNNTVLGYRAGDQITGSNNIAIGYNAQVPVPTSSNQLALGNWLYGTGGFLGINTTTPQYKLDIDAQTGSAGNPLRLLGLNAGATSDSLLTSSSGIVRRVAFSQFLGTNAWSTTGNAGTVDGTNFLGTTDNIPLSIRVNNSKSGRIDHLTGNTTWGYLAGNVTTGINNTFSGQQAGTANTTGRDNTAFGYQALGTNTTAPNNTAIGSEALVSNTTGNDNVAIGRYSMRKNTTFYNNTAVGTYSLQENVGGYYNTAMGWSALNQNTSGFNNVGIGAQALLANTTGNSNVSIGMQSLYFNTTGSNNTSVGIYSMFANMSGNNNTAFGTNTLGYNSTAWGNTAFGYQAAFANTTGQGLVAIGDSALYNSLTASGNTALGYRAGTVITTGSNNTFIGYLSNAASNALTNATAIGANASVGASNSLVLGGTGANVVNVGIGTTTPGAALEVKSSTALSTGIGVKFRSSTLDSVLTLGNDANFKFRNNSSFDFGTDVNNFIAGYTLSSAGFRTFTPSYGRGFFGIESLLASGGTTAASNYYGFRSQLIEESTHSTALNETYAGIFNFKKKGSGNYTFHQNMISNLILDGGSGTITTADGVVGQITMGSGTANITTGNILRANLGDWVSGYSGTITNLRGLYINYMGHARVTNAYGLYVEDVANSVNNYAIYTNAGKVRFGGISSATDANVVTIDGSGNLTQRNIYGVAWNQYGNSGTNPSSQFIGNTDAVDLAFRTNNTEQMRITSSGNVGIGTTTPNSDLDVNGSVAAAITTTSSNLTLNASHYTVIITGAATITFPAASTCARRIYVIVNRSGAARTVSAYSALTGFTSGTLANLTSIMIQSDGTTWYQIK